MDAQTERLLRRLALPALRIVGLPELEAFDPGLAAVKSSRNRVEYCWTATPATCLYLLAHEPAADTVTYVDADLMFFSSPEPLLAELGDGSILLTRHGYVAGQDTRAGRFCVQFLPFRRDANGLAALRWWHERCLEWCYDRPEDGKFGDQAYLDDWPDRFRGVRVLRHPGALAPWDVAAHRLERRGDRIVVDGEPLVFFHFAALRLYRSRVAMAVARRVAGSYYQRVQGSDFGWSTPFRVEGHERRWLWEPYVAQVLEETVRLRPPAVATAPGILRLRPADLAFHVVRVNLPRRLRRLPSRMLHPRLWSRMRRPFYRSG